MRNDPTSTPRRIGDSRSRKRATRPGIEKLMKHFSLDRMQDIAQQSRKSETEASPRLQFPLSAEEYAHLQECAECIEALGETVREGIRNRVKNYGSKDQAT